MNRESGKTDEFNIYSYMNSNAIAKHCKKLGHKFSPSECAYITNASENHPIAEKHAMYSHIINTMPDEQIKLHGSSKYYPEVSLHETLKKYMEIENNALKSFYAADGNHIYSCDVYYCGMPSLFPCGYGPYKDLSDFWNELEKDDSEDFTKIRVTKTNLITQKKSTFTLNGKKEPVFLGYEDLSDEECDIVMMFDLMWFICPTPFKKGDIVSFHPEALVEDTEEFVLESICYENMDEKHLKMRREIGGSMDMTADGYFADTDGQLYGECIHDYLSLEYCNKELTDVKRVLKPVSSYMKGEISLHLAMNAYMSVIMQGKINQINRSYSEEYLISAGLKGEKMKIKTVKIGLENTSDITIPYEDVSYIMFDGKDISECDVDSLDLPNFKIRFRFDTGFFGNYIEEYEDWAQGDQYGVMNVILCYDDGTEKCIELPWKDNDTNSAAEYNHYEVTRHIERDVVIEVDKFNIYGYINSDAIGSHCQKIMHKFSAAESAYIVNSSNRHTLKEKHKMFKHIARTMPDEMIRSYTADGINKVSLHETLKDYIMLQNKIVDDFKRKEDGFVYSCLVYYIRRFEPEEYGPYGTEEDLFSDIEGFSDDAIGKIIVKKISLCDRGYESAVFNSDREIVSVYSGLLSENEMNLSQMFDLMWFVCPTPFKKGDIVYAPNISRTYPPTPDSEPFVLDRLCYENADSRYFSNKYDHGDSSDMTAVGYFQDDDGKIYMDCMHDYLSLEYYSGKLDGKLRIIKALSKYLKGEIPLDLLLNAYDIIIKEENLDKTKRYMNFLEQDLKDIGI